MHFHLCAVRPSEARRPRAVFTEGCSGSSRHPSAACRSNGDPLRPSTHLRELSTLARKDFVLSFKSPAEMGHMRESPAKSNIADCAVILLSIFQSSQTAIEPSRQDEAHDRFSICSQESICVSHANTCGVGHYGAIQTGIGEPRFNCGPYRKQCYRSSRGNAWL
jgi:hypothetical protein